MALSASPESQHVRGLGEGQRRTPQRLEAVVGLDTEVLDPLTRTLDAQHAWIGEFASALVLPGSLAQMLGGLFDVQDVIDNLIHQPDCIAIGREYLKFRRIRGVAATGGQPGDGPDADRGPQQGTCLLGVDQLEFRFLIQPVRKAAQRVVHLPGDHAVGTRDQFTDEGHGRVRIFRSVEERPVGEIEHGVPGKHSHGFARVYMQRGSSPAEVIVIHRGQVIVHQTEGMNHLNGDAPGHTRPACERITRRYSRVPDQQRTQALPAAQESVPDSFTEVGVGVQALNERRQRGFDLGDRREHVGVGLLGVLGARHRGEGSDDPTGLPCGALTPTHTPIPWLMQGLIDTMTLLLRTGGWVMYPLLACSLLSLTLTVERILFWMSTHAPTRRRWLQGLLEQAREGDLQAMAAAAKKDRSVYGVFVRTTLPRSQSDTTGPGTAHLAAELIRPSIERFGTIMTVIIAAAPLLGILGTVLGIITSFQLLGESGPVTDPTAIAAGIAEALYTTAFGLMVALLTLFPHAIFRAQGERCLGRMEALGALIASAGLCASQDTGKDPA